MTYYFKMANSLRISVFICTSLYAGVVLSQNRHNSYATILQDTRNEPTPDGTFGYMYKTEDGILSVARGDPTGLIQGTFSYTDPTGLRVNYNYNAGNRRAPAGAAPKKGIQPSKNVHDEEPQYDSFAPDEVEYVPQSYKPRVRRPIYADVADVYQQRKKKPIRPTHRANVVYDENYY
ncbi:unnamed protein product [Acanthoscelides obtectus]|uniref:Uncharacterized protein n=1 Tax=Acanthoscelides obtectus TaxID=200917 RepID=A0A9P0KML6_ACAOB|nr:unnamed protein product [Acanthoscelides obtectus]CAK1666663.1 hypothetical protein AOBTE_LOCUS25426 [Acanthoscelides obtectus]